MNRQEFFLVYAVDGSAPRPFLAESVSLFSRWQPPLIAFSKHLRSEPACRPRGLIIKIDGYRTSRQSPRASNPWNLLHLS
jgi:hypothetical protein